MYKNSEKTLKIKLKNAVEKHYDKWGGKVELKIC